MGRQLIELDAGVASPGQAPDAWLGGVTMRCSGGSGNLLSIHAANTLANNGRERRRTCTHAARAATAEMSAVANPCDRLGPRLGRLVIGRLGGSSPLVGSGIAGGHGRICPVWLRAHSRLANTLTTRRTHDAQRTSPLRLEPHKDHRSLPDAAAMREAERLEQISTSFSAEATSHSPTAARCPCLTAGTSITF